jgi:radical SAM superfamily enzyme YgiQ (UPF0313 family)
MNVLLIYPKHPDTFWSFKHALKFISKKASVPPLGLITVSAMLPTSWNKKLLDMNVSELKLNDIAWADYVFLSAMYVQKQSVDEVIAVCKKHSKKLVAGGPLFTQEYKSYPQVDHFILNEAELTLPKFLNDIKAGKTLKKVYQSNQFAEMKNSPVPDFHLLERKKYAAMNIQVSRGCPYSCEFCEITALLGHKVRMKSTQQIIDELEVLWNLNWRGDIAIVDDNFIGNKSEIKNNLLPAIKNWMREHKLPFSFNIQTTINLASDEELMKLMVESGFNSAFIGIETPSEKSLIECNKLQNKNINMIASVKKLQRAGIQVSGGFIVGFDNDSPNIFQRQIEFIQQSGIVSAMIGLLNAPKNTRLYKRLKAENRLIAEVTGNNTDYSMNFKPRMNTGKLLTGYKEVIKNIYNSKPYYKRVRQLLMNYKKQHARRNRFQYLYVVAFFKSLIVIGILNKGQLQFWKNLFWTLFKRPKLIVEAIMLSIYGHHFRTVYGLRNKKAV